MGTVTSGGAWGEWGGVYNMDGIRTGRERFSPDRGWGVFFRDPGLILYSV